MQNATNYHLTGFVTCTCTYTHKYIYYLQILGRKCIYDTYYTYVEYKYVYIYIYNISFHTCIMQIVKKLLGC